MVDEVEGHFCLGLAHFAALANDASDSELGEVAAMVTRSPLWSSAQALEARHLRVMSNSSIGTGVTFDMFAHLGKAIAERGVGVAAFGQVIGAAEIDVEDRCKHTLCNPVNCSSVG